MQSCHLESWGTEQSGGEQREDLGSTRGVPPTEVWIYPDKTEFFWGDGDPATPGALRVLPIKLFDITRDFKREVSTGTKGSHPVV